jgi:hypothetical protein|tara:strand:- start:20260 stop:22722 length:2463 start_codon:yes stop_codon:yes gene_type:complete
MNDEGAIEQREDIEKGEDGEVKLWSLEIKKATETEERWRRDGHEALKIYRRDVWFNNDSAKRRETFNILWANTETISPILYNSTPRPDIRRRYRDKDPLGKAVAEVCERSITYTLDAQDFDVPMMAAVNDSLLPGRAVTRVRYVPSFATKSKVEEAGTNAPDEPEEELAFEEVKFEQVQWDDFRRGPGKSWFQVPWVAFRHKLTKDQIKEKFPGFEDKIHYDATITDDDNRKDDGNDDNDKLIFKRALIWEVWDKETKQVIFFSPTYKDAILSKEPDQLKLRDFWPIPRPLYAIESSTNLIPSTLYSMYETLAKELEACTNRIKKIMEGLRLRGIYDSTIAELPKLFDSFDNSFVPAENIVRLMEAGGLEKAIWTLPIDMYAEVLVQLYQYRQALLKNIYEITGISDVLRGDTDPNETLGAQQLKADFASQRIQKNQKEVARYSRDLVRIATELIAERFNIDTLRLMTGLKFPTKEEKQQAQMQMQMQQQQAQQMGQPPQPPPPQLLEILQTPSWEEIKEVMEHDMMRDYRIDIETDSTIQAQQQEDQKNVTELLGGITKFFAEVAPAIEAGVMTIDTAKSMLLSAVRRFKLGREVEDAIENIEPQQQSKGVPQEEVEKQVQQAQQQAKQQVTETEGKLKENVIQEIKRAKDLANDAIKQAQQVEAQSKQQLTEVVEKTKAEIVRSSQVFDDAVKKFGDKLESEKARNALAEKAQKLAFDEQIFALKQQLGQVTKQYEDDGKNQTRSAAIEMVKSRDTAEQSAKTPKEGEKPVKVDGLEKFAAAMSKSVDSKVGEIEKVIEALDKPRKVVRKDGEITGIE